MTTVTGKLAEAATKQYLPIYLETLRVDSILDFDLFIKIEREFILYRSRNLPFAEAAKLKLLDNHVARLYIDSQEKAYYQRYIEQNLNMIIADTKVPELKKAKIIYETSKALVKDVLDNPTLSENIHRSKELVVNTVDYILRGREAFLNLLQITSFDYYTYTHSVNVCTFTIALAQAIGIRDKRVLHDLGVGALLHDVGKIRVPERILNKRSALNRSEFEIMKRHPGWGNDILRQSDLLVENSYFPVMQHHERLDGSGYPKGLTSSQIHDFGLLIMIADVFDALTTRRVYQDAMETYPALKIMYGMKGQFHEAYLRKFTVLMGPNQYLDSSTL